MDASYAITRVFATLEERGIEAVIPAKAERPPKRGTIPVRRFKLDAKNRVVRCPAGRFLRPHGKPDSDGFQHYRARIPDCRSCRLRSICFSPAIERRAILLHKDHPALLRARRKSARWGAHERALYRSHRVRVKGFHGEAKTWHGLARAVRRGLANMRIQAYLTAAAVNLKRLAIVLLRLLLAALAASARRIAVTADAPTPLLWRGCAFAALASTTAPRPFGVLQQPRAYVLTHPVSGSDSASASDGRGSAFAAMCHDIRAAVSEVRVPEKPALRPGRLQGSGPPVGRDVGVGYFSRDMGEMSQHGGMYGSGQTISLGACCRKRRGSSASVRPCANRADRMQVRDDQRTKRPHLVSGRQQVRHHDHGGSGQMGGANPVVGILEHEALGRVRPDLRGRAEEQVGMRLAPCDIVAGHDGVEAMQDSDLPEMAFGFGAAR